MAIELHTEKVINAFNECFDKLDKLNIEDFLVEDGDYRKAYYKCTLVQNVEGDIDFIILEFPVPSNPELASISFTHDYKIVDYNQALNDEILERGQYVHGKYIDYTIN